MSTFVIPDDFSSPDLFSGPEVFPLPSELLASHGVNPSSLVAGQDANGNYNMQASHLLGLLRQEASLDREFQTNSAKLANEFQKEMWQKSADYNTTAADVARSFQAEREDLAYLRNKEMYQQQRQDYLKDRGTAYQAAVADMKRAGLNPALALGSAAPTASISSHSASAGASPMATAPALPSAHSAKGSKADLGSLAGYLSSVASATTNAASRISSTAIGSILEAALPAVVFALSKGKVNTIGFK